MYDPVGTVCAALMTLGCGGFNPATCFGADAIGAVWDMSNMASMYQDAAGLTPATSHGQPVGLHLDSKHGLARGPEIFTNSDFSAGSTDWSMPAGGSVSSGTCVFTGVASGQVVSQPGKLVIGKYYEIQFDLVSCSAGGFRSSRATTAPTATIPGRYSVMFEALAINDAGIRAVGVTTGVIDNLSIKEVLGVHLFATGADRPTLARHPASGLWNLLTWTEDFSNAVWGKTNLTVTANAANNYEGALVADKLIPSATSNVHCLTTGVSKSGITTYTTSIRAKAAGYNKLCLMDPQHSALGSQVVDLRDGSKASISNTASGSVTNVIPLGDGWYRITWTWTGYPIGAVNYSMAVVVLPDSGVTNSFSGVWTGDGVSGVLIDAGQLSLVDVAYQKVTTAYDVTESGQRDLWYTVGGYMFTSILAPVAGATKAQMFLGIGNSNYGTECLAEYSTDYNFNTRSFFCYRVNSQYQFSSRGDAAGSGAHGSNYSGVPSPDRAAVVYGLFSMDTDLSRNGRNKVAGTDATGDQGGGQFGNHRLYVNRRGGVANLFTGRVYGRILRIAQTELTDAQVALCSDWLNKRAAAY